MGIFHYLCRHCTRSYIPDNNATHKFLYVCLNHVIIKYIEPDKVLNFLNELIELTHPTDVVIVFDGVPHLSKMEYQRNRCYMSSNINSFDRTSIIAGTPFMRQMKSILYDWMKNTIHNINIVINDNDIGDCESKIINDIRAKDDKQTFIIYGSDIELIYMSLGLGHQNIYMIMEDFKYICMSSVRKKLFKDNQNPIEIITLLCMLGNCHIPSLYEASDFQRLHQYYKNMNKAFVDPKTGHYKLHGFNIEVLKGIIIFMGAKSMDYKYNLYDNEDVYDQCVDYLATLIWTVFYFDKGVSIYSGVRYYNFNISPAITDIRNALFSEHIECDIIKRLDDFNALNIKNDIDLYHLMILPKWSAKRYSSNQVNQIMKTCNYFYPDKFNKINNSPNLPIIDTNLLNSYFY